MFRGNHCSIASLSILCLGAWGVAGSWNAMFSISFETSQITDDIMRMTRSHIQCTSADRAYVPLNSQTCIQQEGFSVEVAGD